jgi:hypothetical protein
MAKPGGGLVTAGQHVVDPVAGGKFLMAMLRRQRLLAVPYGT